MLATVWLKNESKFPEWHPNHLSTKILDFLSASFIFQQIMIYFHKTLFFIKKWNLLFFRDILANTTKNKVIKLLLFRVTNQLLSIWLRIRFLKVFLTEWLPQKIFYTYKIFLTSKQGCLVHVMMYNMSMHQLYSALNT